jgi:hypothetical protein
VSRLTLSEHGVVQASRFTLRANEFDMQGPYGCYFCDEEVEPADRANGEVWLVYQNDDGRPGVVCDACGEKYAPDLHALQLHARSNADMKARPEPDAPEDDALDIMYPGLCADCAKTLHLALACFPKPDPRDTELYFDDNPWSELDRLRGDLLCTHMLPRRPELIAHVVTDLLSREYFVTFRPAPAVHPDADSLGGTS